MAPKLALVAVFLAPTLTPITIPSPALFGLLFRQEVIAAGARLVWWPLAQGKA
ncbi:hypothetical protein [Polyangium mundeleinium]|uniref:Uncharacterized protein n=1 Tax=Polyangium mundeleinium TaxID=2995306 RepID=A0ABT5EYC5_9BACT|nr:hypothetical protein [Polyangium mundeleinium]MDC0745810.1 hypothetical protein [Polyangium mundeleinium]